MSELGDQIRAEAEISDRPGQMDRLIAIAEQVDRLQRGARELGKTIEQQCRMVLDVTGAYDCVDADGDGDWGAIWDRLYELRVAHPFASLPPHRTEAGWPRCATCDGGGCLDCTDPA